MDYNLYLFFCGNTVCRSHHDNTTTLTNMLDYCDFVRNGKLHKIYLQSLVLTITILMSTLIFLKVHADPPACSLTIVVSLHGITSHFWFMILTLQLYSCSYKKVSMLRYTKRLFNFLSNFISEAFQVFRTSLFLELGIDANLPFH